MDSNLFARNSAAFDLKVYGRNAGKDGASEKTSLRINLITNKWSNEVMEVFFYNSILSLE